MTSTPRHVPPGSLVEITMRTSGGFFLLRPSPELNARILGILGRALVLYPVALHAFVFLSNHWHGLVTVCDAERLSSFLRYVNSNVAKAVQDVHGWKAKVWGRRAETISVVDDAAAEGRLRYILSNSVKEGLVASPVDWPGVSSARALLLGEELEGFWRNGTRAARLARTRQPFSDDDVTTRYAIPLTPLPSWVALSPDQRRAAVATMIEEIVREGREAHPTPMGGDAIHRVNPFSAPLVEPKRTAPRCHATSKAARAHYLATRAEFIDGYRAATRHASSAASKLSARYPSGAFPPRPPLSPIPAPRATAPRAAAA